MVSYSRFSERQKSLNSSPATNSHKKKASSFLKRAFRELVLHRQRKCGRCPMAVPLLSDCQFFDRLRRGGGQIASYGAVLMGIFWTAQIPNKVPPTAESTSVISGHRLGSKSCKNSTPILKNRANIRMAVRADWKGLK